MPKNREGKFYSREVRGRPETDRERKERIMPGYDEMKKLSHGIMEEDDDDCARLYYCDDDSGECQPIETKLDEENENFDDEGKFSDEKSATCKSSYFVDKKRKRVGGSLSKPSSEYGRGKAKDSQGPRRCKDDSIKEVIDSEMSSGNIKSLTGEDLFVMIREAIAMRREGPPGGGGG